MIFVIPFHILKSEVKTKYLLLEPRVKAIAPNIALMKFARWCENNNHEYQYVRGCVSKERIEFEPDIILMSCIFSYYSERYKQTILHYIKKFPYVKIIIGGVFPTLYPHWFDELKTHSAFTVSDLFGSLGAELNIRCGMAPELESLIPKYNVDIISEDTNPYPRDKIVLYASRGCVNKCGYCAVPRLEGGMNSFESIKDMIDTGKRELPNAKSIVLYDNNFTEHEYFDNIVDEIKASGLPVDIHGLHVEAFTEHHAERFAELEWAAQGEAGTPYLRFSFDWMKYAPNVERAYNIYMNHNIKAGFFCYMLFNWVDSPEDFWHRIVKCQEIVGKTGKPIFLFPQRYEPFKPRSKDKTKQGLKRNQYVSPNWNADQLRGVTRMYTWVHGFLSVTKSENLFNWIGKNCDEFLKRIMEMSKINKLEKITDDRKADLNECLHSEEISV